MPRARGDKTQVPLNSIINMVAQPSVGDGGLAHKNEKLEAAADVRAKNTSMPQGERMPAVVIAVISLVLLVAPSGSDTSATGSSFPASPGTGQGGHRQHPPGPSAGAGETAKEKAQRYREGLAAYNRKVGLRQL